MKSLQEDFIDLLKKHSVISIKQSGTRLTGIIPLESGSYASDSIDVEEVNEHFLIELVEKCKKIPH